MQAKLEGETRQVIRRHRGVIWCPFCDRSRQESRATPFCEGCGAEFVGIPVETTPEPHPDGVDRFITQYNDEPPDQMVPLRRTRGRPRKQA